MNKNLKTKQYYDEQYKGKSYYWSERPSAICFEVLKHLPPVKPLKLLDIGCGEGRNAVFFARNGYEVHAFDFSKKGVEKTIGLGKRIGVELKVFEADINDFRLNESYDVLFSTGMAAVTTILLYKYYYQQEDGFKLSEKFKFKRKDKPPKEKKMKRKKEVSEFDTKMDLQELSREVVEKYESKPFNEEFPFEE